MIKFKKEEIKTLDLLHDNMKLQLLSNVNCLEIQKTLNIEIDVDKDLEILEKNDRVTIRIKNKEFYTQISFQIFPTIYTFASTIAEHLMYNLYDTMIFNGTTIEGYRSLRYYNNIQNLINAKINKISDIFFYIPIALNKILAIKKIVNFKNLELVNNLTDIEKYVLYKAISHSIYLRSETEIIKKIYNDMREELMAMLKQDFVNYKIIESKDFSVMEFILKKGLIKDV